MNAFRGQKTGYFTLIILFLLDNGSNAWNPNGTQAAINHEHYNYQVIQWCPGGNNGDEVNILKISVYQHPCDSALLEQNR